MQLHKIFLITISFGLFLFTGVNLAKAQPTNEDSGNFGLGIMLGEPTGVSVKYWNNSRSAFGIGAAWSLAERTEALHLHADYLSHSWFNNTENLAFYYGIGGRVIFADNTAAGVRVPFGLNYAFQNIPFDLFVEAVPILDISPETEFAGNGAVGIRFYFGK
ncbi:MAG: hypothetical protein U5K69_24455 [Balneolaceae bacterium]|nr:hypothetical protein [Balneolaceae bacterium]